MPPAPPQARPGPVEVGLRPGQPGTPIFLGPPTPAGQPPPPRFLGPPTPAYHGHIEHPNRGHGARSAVTPYPLPGQQHGQHTTENPYHPGEAPPAIGARRIFGINLPAGLTRISQRARSLAPAALNPFEPNNPYPPFTQGTGQRPPMIRR
jgi:hypothetical protein